LSAVPDKRRGLGRGLELLVGGPGQPELAHLPVETIHPNPRQPRKRFDHESTSALADSIRAQGLVQPVVVRPRKAGGFELIAGERRWRAAREAGMPTVPALVREADDRDTLLLGLVENVAREQLSAVEEARAYALLLDEFELSLGELSERMGKAKPTVSNRLRLLELPDDVLALVERGDLTEGHARAVLAVPDHDGRRRLAPDRPSWHVGPGGRTGGALGRCEDEATQGAEGRSGACRPGAQGRRARNRLSGPDRFRPPRDRLHGRDRARRAGRSARTNRVALVSSSDRSALTQCHVADLARESRVA
jgi:ParB/RepB/Spo0J family partition protein